MPIYKFKDFEKAEQALWQKNIDAGYLNELRELYKLKKYLSGFVHPHGIFKFKTLNDANNARDEIVLRTAVEKLKLLNNTNTK